jgi:hypothetical protein
MKRKINFAVLVLSQAVAVLVLTGCGGGSSSDSVVDADGSPSQETKTKQAQSRPRSDGPPILSLTSQSGNGTANLNLSGTATDNVRVDAVTWANDRGGSGTASLTRIQLGQVAWAAPLIPLQAGKNSISVTAVDLAGNTARLTATATGPAPSPSDEVRASAAAMTAQRSDGPCEGVQPFYWEIGDKTRMLTSGSVKKAGDATSYTADTQMVIASASKWLYGAYVAERLGGRLSASDVQFLHFYSGYTNFSGCDAGDTVASCVARGSNGVQSPETVDKFLYGGGHMQKHASLTKPGMDLGALDNTALAQEIRRVLGNDINLTYNQPQLAGGVVSSAKDYAVFLRKLLNGQLKMATLLGSNPVCTNPLTCPSALRTPVSSDKSWNYSIGHWLENDPVVGDGAFSSPGAFGFYPWVDASKTYYGVVARVGSGANESAVCGAMIRKAWVTGISQ